MNESSRRPSETLFRRIDPAESIRRPRRTSQLRSAQPCHGADELRWRSTDLMGIHVDDRVPARPPESELRGAVRGETVWEEPTASRKEPRAEPGGPSEEELTGDQLLRLHSRDLIDRLQSWEGTLDAREANLNAREAALERRQRQFRTQRHQWIEELAEQRRKLERIRRQIDAHARRLAFDAA